MISLSFGLPGTGKSTLLHQLVRAQAPSQLFLVHDHEAGWGYDSPLWTGKPPPLDIVQGEDEAKGLLDEERPDRGIFVFRNAPTEAISELAIAWGDLTVVDDELDKGGRKKGFDDSLLRSIVNEGRHLLNAEGEPCQLHVLGACRRPQKLHNDLTELADEVYIFRSMGARTLARLEDDAFLEEEDVEKVRSLPDFALLHWPSRRWLRIQPPREDRNPIA